MSTTTGLETLKINYLTQAQYNTASQNGEINENELYMTPDNGIVVSTEDASSPENYQENSVWLKYGSASGGQADWIVEQGTEGIWTYRKWNSGIAECWGTLTINITSWNAWGNQYEGIGTPNNATYPNGLFISVPDFYASIKGNGIGAFLEVYKAGTTTTTPSLYPIRPNQANLGNFNTSLFAKGTWK